MTNEPGQLDDLSFRDCFLKDGAGGNSPVFRWNAGLHVVVLVLFVCLEEIVR